MAPRRPTPLNFTTGGLGSPPPTTPAAPDEAPRPTDEALAADPPSQTTEAPEAERETAETEPATSALSAPLPEPEAPPRATAVASAAPAELAPALEPGAIMRRLGEPQPSRTGIYLTAGLACLLWAGAVAAFAFGYISKSGFALAPLTVVFLTLLAIAPMGVI